MTTRERWIVYPLLFLALGASIKSHLVRRFECDTLVVSNIEIVDRQSRPQVVLRATPNGGELSLLSAKTTAQTTISAGRVRVQNVQIVDLHGRLQGMLAASPDGAVLTLHDQDGRVHTQLIAGGLQTTRIQADVVQTSLVRVVGSDGKPQVALKATPEGVGQLHLINKNNGARIVHLINKNNGESIVRIAPATPLVPPVKVDGKQPTEKKPEPKKGTEKSAPRS